MGRKKAMLKKNDKVQYAQMEMFDTSLVGKNGYVLDLLTQPCEEHKAIVFFSGLGVKTVPTCCLVKI